MSGIAGANSDSGAGVVGFLQSDGGPHPAEKWAVITASQMIAVEGDLGERELAQKAELERKVVSILTRHFRGVQSSEQALLAKLGDARRDSPLDPTPHLDAPLREINSAADGTIFAAHFAKPEVAHVLRAILGKDMASAMQLERAYWPAGAA